MSAMLLSKEKWPEFVGKLTGKNLWAPKLEGEAMRFAPLAAGEEISLDYGNTRVPPKGATFPQTETMYRFLVGNQELEEPKLEEEAVFLGIRPCDARAMAIVEKLFRWDYDDPYYLKRRELVTLVGLACNEPGLNCFCSSVGGAPDSTEGLDLIMYDLGDNYLFEAVTAKGEALLAETKELLPIPMLTRLKQRRNWLPLPERRSNALWITRAFRKVCPVYGKIRSGRESLHPASVAVPALTFAQPATVLISRMRWKVLKRGVAGLGIPVCSKSIPCIHPGTTPGLPVVKEPGTALTINIITMSISSMLLPVLAAGGVSTSALSISTLLKS
jgi:hypothetical protein